MMATYAVGHIIFSGRPPFFTEESNCLVELGVARFSSDTNHPISLDEPLALFATINAFRQKKMDPVQCFLENAFQTGESHSRGLTFEKVIALYLYTKFQGQGTPANKVFDFIGEEPSWASHRAHLITV